MPYLISFSKWPSDKTVEVIKKVIEANKKYPPDESLGEEILPGNAIKAFEEGFKTLSITNVSKGKLDDAYNRAVAIANLYAMAIEGFEYKLEVWSNVEEAYSSIGQKPPE
jgi:hypothetical protein